MQAAKSAQSMMEGQGIQIVPVQHAHVPVASLWNHVELLTSMLFYQGIGQLPSSQMTKEDHDSFGGVRCRCGCVVYPPRQSEGPGSTVQINHGNGSLGLVERISQPWKAWPKTMRVSRRNGITAAPDHSLVNSYQELSDEAPEEDEEDAASDGCISCPHSPGVHGLERQRQRSSIASQSDDSILEDAIAEQQANPGRAGLASATDVHSSLSDESARKHPNRRRIVHAPSKDDEHIERVLRELAVPQQDADVLPSNEFQENIVGSTVEHFGAFEPDPLPDKNCNERIEWVRGNPAASSTGKSLTSSAMERPFGMEAKLAANMDEQQQATPSKTPPAARVTPQESVDQRRERRAKELAEEFDRLVGRK